MQLTTESRTKPSPRPSSQPILGNLRTAAIHAAQSKLMLRRAAVHVSDPDQGRALHDLAGILQHVIAEIDALMRIHA